MSHSGNPSPHDVHNINCDRTYQLQSFKNINHQTAAHLWHVWLQGVLHDTLRLTWSSRVTLSNQTINWRASCETLQARKAGASLCFVSRTRAKGSGGSTTDMVPFKAGRTTCFRWCYGRISYWRTVLMFIDLCFDKYVYVCIYTYVRMCLSISRVGIRRLELGCVRGN